MELLQKALFNLPRVAANTNSNQDDISRAAALDKLGLGHLYGAHVAAAAAAAASAANQGAPPVNQHAHSPASALPAAAAAYAVVQQQQHQQQAQAQAPPTTPAAAAAAPPTGVNNFGVEAVSPNIVFDVASLVLYGTHAIPVKLKILLDRLFSVLSQDDVLQILKGYGWTLDDYQRGYILKDNRGTPLERWQMCSKEEEPLVLQQFLRFGETRSITQQFILQELSERSNEEHRVRVQSEIKKLMERNSVAAAAAAAAAAQAAALRPPPTSPLTMNNNNGLQQNSKQTADRDSTSSPARSPHSKASPSVSPSSSSVVSPKAPGGLASPSSTTPKSSVNGTAGVPPSSPRAASSPLNRLQSMQPFDYRKAGEAKTPDSISSRGSIERPLPASIPHTMGRMPPAGMGGLGMPLIPNVSVPPSLASYHNSITKAQQEYQMSKIADENSQSALNLTSARVGTQGRGEARPIPSSRTNESARRSTEKSSDDGNNSSLADIRKKLRDNIGMSYISPTTGKKRAQCNTCLKTFCDKGALKIHFSAVHLREMHKCTYEGCNMMFSSRRSRNRHSANPNPKLHTPHLRRKISPHDGRTHQGPFLPGSLAALAVSQNQLKTNAPQVPGSNPPAPPGPATFPSLQSFPGAGAFGANIPGLGPNSMLTPENLQNFQRQQMEFQRLHELKMSGLYGGHQNFDAKRHMLGSGGGEDGESESSDSKRIRFSDSENDGKEDDIKSVDNQSAKDEASSGGALSGAGGGSKRKSRNPTRIHQGNNVPQRTAEGGNADEEGFSSDDDDEGFENPLDDDDDDDLDDIEDHDNDQDGNGASGPPGGNNPGSGSGNDSRGKSPPPPGSDNTNNPSDQGSLYPTEMNGLAAQLRHNYTITQHG